MAARVTKTIDGQVLRSVQLERGTVSDLVVERCRLVKPMLGADGGAPTRTRLERVVLRDSVVVGGWAHNAVLRDVTLEDVVAEPDPPPAPAE